MKKYFLKLNFFLIVILLLPFSASAVTLFSEGFENTNFASRGWYDETGGAITTDHVEGANAFECHYLSGGAGCSSGGPGRL